MARTFNGLTANNLHVGTGTLGALLNGAPAISFAALVRPAGFAGVGTLSNRLLATNINSGAQGLIAAFDPEADATVGSRSQAGDTLQTYQSANTFLANDTWQHYGTVSNFAAGTQSTYRNGVLSGPVAATYGQTAYTVGTPAGFDRFGGTTDNNNNMFNGDLEFVALWNIDIGDAGFQALNSGTHPIDVQSANLVFCMVLGYETPDVDLVGGTIESTIAGSLPFVEGPTGLPPEPPAAGSPFSLDIFSADIFTLSDGSRIFVD